MSAVSPSPSSVPPRSLGRALAGLNAVVWGCQRGKTCLPCSHHTVAEEWLYRGMLSQLPAASLLYCRGHGRLCPPSLVGGSSYHEQLVHLALASNVGLIVGKHLKPEIQSRVRL